MSGTVIRKCNCEHSFQDKLYGFSMRVFNVGKGLIRCTVCGKTLKEEVKTVKKDT